MSRSDSRVVRGPSMGQIELFNHLLNFKLFMLNRITSVKLFNCVQLELSVLNSNT